MEAVVQHPDWKSLLDSLNLPSEWIADGVEPPSRDCLEASRRLLERLFDNYNGLTPYKIAPSKEGGVFVAYRHSVSGNVIRIEVDGEFDMVATVSDGQRILHAGFCGDAASEQALIRALETPRRKLWRFW